MIENSDKNRVDDDIAQCKEDIIRSFGPLPDDAGQPNPPVPIKTIEQKPPKIAAIVEIKTASPQSPPAADNRSRKENISIPQFDLAEKIMAEQRKAISVRRKGPDKKDQPDEDRPPAGLSRHAIEQPAESISDRDGLIAEIVARDIERMCRGN